MPAVGTILDGKYEILTALDEGGMSWVYLAVSEGPLSVRVSDSYQ